MEEVEEMEGGAEEAGTICVTLGNILEILGNFCLTFCFLSSLKMFQYGTNSPSSIYFRFSANIIEGSMSLKRVKSSLE